MASAKGDEDHWTVVDCLCTGAGTLGSFKTKNKAFAFAKYQFTVKPYSSLVVIPPPSAFGEFPQVVTPTFGWPCLSVDDYKKEIQREKKDKDKLPPSKPKPKST